MIKKLFWVITSILLLLIHGCRNEMSESHSASQTNSGFQLKGTFIHKDSVARPVVNKVSYRQVTPAHVIEQIPVVSNRKNLIHPEITPAKSPMIQTPGKDQFILPEKVKANPTIITSKLPEVVKLKNPTSRDINPYSFMAYSKTQGLTHDYISSFHEDDEGNMWVTSSGGGLMKFDGRYIHNYNKNQGANINDIMQARGDENGNIWLTTFEGLFMLNGLEIVHYNAESGSLRNNTLHSVEFDTEGNLWISYRFGGISMFDGEYFYHFDQEQGLPEAARHILRTDNHGNVWISLYDKGLAVYKNGSFHIYEVPYNGPDSPIMTVAIDDQKDEVWLSIMEKGIVKFDGTAFHSFTLENGFPFGRINRMRMDSQGRNWIGTWGKGIVVLDGDEYIHFEVEHGLSNNYITDLYEDSRGIMWIAFFNGGMARYFGDIFKHYSIKQGIDQDIISMVQTHDGRIWFSTHEQGFLSFDGSTFVRYSNRPNRPVAYMEGLYADENGEIWMSVDEGGISRFDGKNFYHYQLDSLPEEFYITEGTTAKDGSIWFLSFLHGVVKYDHEGFTIFNSNNGLTSQPLYTITSDKTGNVWLGTWGDGVCKVDDTGFTYFTTRHGLAGNYIFSAFEDYYGNLWFGTEGHGVSMFNGERFISFTSRNGLSDNYIFSITQDQQGNMIFGARFGINILSAENLEKITRLSYTAGKNELRESESIFFVSHSYDDGFLGMGCNQGSLVASGNKVWVGANDRLTVFYPENSWYDNVVPRVQVTRIELFNEPLNWSDLNNQTDPTITLSGGVKAGKIRFDSISPWSQIPYNLKLSNRNNFVTFGFSGLSPYSGKLVYSFFLEGADQNWHHPTRDNKAHYGNLSPGSYTFKVRAMNPLGAWGDTYEYSFVILAPWWQTWWAWALYVIAVILLLRAFISLRIKSLVLKNKVLDNEVELARKSIEIKQNILANVSHEIRTPLTGIIGLSDLLADTSLNATQKEYIKTLKQTGQNLKEIINQILDYSKIESGQVSLINVTFSLDELFTHAQKVFGSLKNGKDIALETRLDPEAAILIYGDRGRINQVLQNLLYNAVKFTRQGKISLSASLEERKIVKDGKKEYEDLLLKITVADTGVGIPEEAMSKLFVPFSQIEVKDTRESDSTGLGLAISKKLTEMLGGEIGLESQVGKGSEFWFTFRARKACPLTVENVDDPAHISSQMPPMRILLVEDKKVNQLVVKLILEKMGHKVTIAAHGQIALDIFRPGEFDLIFMDIQMPVMDGITATRQLRSRYTNLPPIIGLSANAFEGDRERYMAQGMDEYVVKPVSEASLRKAILTTGKLVD